MTTKNPNELRDALLQSKSSLVAVAWLSALINILLLGGPIYMMLIYDSVLPSGSMETLFGLLGIVTLVFAFQGLFDFLRSRILANVAARFDELVTVRVQVAIGKLTLKGRDGQGDGLTPMRDLDSIRSFIAGPGPGAIIDLPWMLLFLAFLTFLHVWLGVTTFLGAVILIILTLLNDKLSRTPNRQATTSRAVRARLAQNHQRQSEIIRVLGMGQRVSDHWQAANAGYNMAQDRLVQTASVMSGISRTFRMFLQSFVLTVGALLYLSGEASGGIIFAASILAARALAPIDQAIACSGAFTAARQGWTRLNMLLADQPPQDISRTSLPRPETSFRAEKIAVMLPETGKILLQGVDFQLTKGDALGLIGPSASGKTSLARTLLGLWQPASGVVRMDGASIDQWQDDNFGSFVGYLPQQIELFEGTIAENICRFEPSAPSAAIIEAATIGGVHDMIVNLEMGYETLVGAEGCKLSAGQRQRIGLARALYRNPFLVVLDEPNSNLDAEGEEALDRAVANLRSRGAILIIIAHRTAALKRVNKVLVLQDGRMTAFGDRDEVLALTVIHNNKAKHPKSSDLSPAHQL